MIIPGMARDRLPSPARIARALSLLAFCTFTLHTALGNDSKPAAGGVTQDFVVDASSPSVHLQTGVARVIDVAFTLGIVSIGNPEIVDLVISPTKPYPQIQLLGRSTGTTNLMVYDSNSKLRISMLLTVSSFAGEQISDVTLMNGPASEDKVVCGKSVCEKLAK